MDHHTLEYRNSRLPALKCNSIYLPHSSKYSIFCGCCLKGISLTSKTTLRANSITRKTTTVDTKPELGLLVLILPAIWSIMQTKSKTMLIQKAPRRMVMKFLSQQPRNSQQMTKEQSTMESRLCLTVKSKSWMSMAATVTWKMVSKLALGLRQSDGYSSGIAISFAAGYTYCVFQTGVALIGASMQLLSYTSCCSNLFWLLYSYCILCYKMALFLLSILIFSQFQRKPLSYSFYSCSNCSFLLLSCLWQQGMPSSLLPIFTNLLSKILIAQLSICANVRILDSPLLLVSACVHIQSTILWLKSLLRSFLACLLRMEVSSCLVRRAYSSRLQDLNILSILVRLSLSYGWIVITSLQYIQIIINTQADKQPQRYCGIKQYLTKNICIVKSLNLIVLHSIDNPLHLVYNIKQEVILFQILNHNIVCTDNNQEIKIQVLNIGVFCIPKIYFLVLRSIILSWHVYDYKGANQLLYLMYLVPHVHIRLIGQVCNTSENIKYHVLLWGYMRMGKCEQQLKDWQLVIKGTKKVQLPGISCEVGGRAGRTSCWTSGVASIELQSSKYLRYLGSMIFFLYCIFLILVRQRGQLPFLQVNQELPGPTQTSNDSKINASTLLSGTGQVQKYIYNSCHADGTTLRLLCFRFQLVYCLTHLKLYYNIKTMEPVQSQTLTPFYLPTATMTPLRPIVND